VYAGWDKDELGALLDRHLQPSSET
jgi:hypothetical protein